MGDARERRVVGTIGWAGVLLLVVAQPANGAEPVPYGHKDFYPSAERPIGYFGNGNGAYPGATPVTEWADGDCVKPSGNTTKKTTNIVWRTDLPGWSASSAVVVGDRVLVTCDPNILVCADANTGQILWQRDVNPFECLGQTGAEARGRADILEMARAFRHLTAYMSVKRDDDRVKTVHEVTLPKLKEWLGIIEKLEPTLAPALQTAIQVFTDNPNVPLRKCNLDGPGNFSVAVSKKYRIPTSMLWENHHGDTFATPVSDGQFVYVTMAHGQAACYDLNGKRVWGKFFAQDIVDIGCYDCASPRLSGEVLIVVHYDHFRGLDKKTGDVLWECRMKRTLDPQCPGTYAVLDLPKDGGTDPVVVTTYGTINRVKDGAELADLGYRMAWDGGSMSILGEQDYALIQPGGKERKQTDVAAIFLKWNGDKLEVAPPVFMEGMGVSGRTPTLHEGRLFDAGRMWDVRTGKLMCSATRPARSECQGFCFDWPSTILAGAYAITPTDGRNCRFPRGDKGQQAAPILVQKLDGWNPPELVSLPNLLGATGWPKSRFLEKFLPEICTPGKEWRSPDYGLYIRFGFAHFTALGNRLFYRTPTHLYCIGDPKVPYDWNPKSRPEAITGTLPGPKAAVPQSHPDGIPDTRKGTP